MKTLTRAQWDLARQWLYTHGRPLDQRLYEYDFEDGPAAAVTAALAEYQNDDGGFGNALEPDIRTPASSVVATTMAFALLRHVGAEPDKPLVQRGIAYFVATYDAAGQRWPMVPPAVEDAPHAPWWTYAAIEQTFDGFALNPTAVVVGHLFDYAELSPIALRQTALDAVLARLSAIPDPLSRDTLQCLLSLCQARGLDEAARQAIEQRIIAAIPATVVQDPERWSQYCLTPLEVATTPDARFASHLDRRVIDVQLDSWIDAQADDGAWPLTWSWAQVDEAAWRQAEAEWKGRHIVDRLATLKAYGRVEA